MVQFIFIRHGESTDNLRGVWAGWRDSALSNHGMRPWFLSTIHLLQQAEALAADLAETRLSAIYCSDLVRAQRTAAAVKEKQLQAYPARPSPSASSASQTRTALIFQESALLREQNFGAGEGMKFAKKDRDLSLEAHFAKGKFPMLYTRQQCFPGGESLDGVAQRAEDAFRQLLEQHVRGNGNQNEVVAVVSHGLFLAELIAVIVKKDTEFKGDLDVKNLRMMKNTAWTKLDVKLKASSSTDSYAAALSVRVLGVNRHRHLSNLHRQGGGIGSSAHDPNQQDIRAFLGGGTGGGGKTKPASKSKSKSTTKPLRPKPY